MRRSLALACPLVLLLACGGSDSEAGGNAGGSGGNGNGNGSGNGGDGDGTGNGNGDGDGGGGGGGGIIGCGDRAITPGRVTPDILVVLDRSTSMRMNGVNRWDPSVEGLNAIVGAMEDQVRFGLMTYPARGSGGGGGGGGGWGGGFGGGSCDPGKLDVPIEINNAAAIADMLDDTSPGGYTPTAATLEAVHDIFGIQLSDGQPVAPRYVMLITDGAPNCLGGVGPGGGGGGLDPAAVDATVTAIEALAQEGIPTYVLGYDTQSDRELSSALDRMAVAGATGDQQHRTIGDRASLEQEFAEITGNALTCDYLLAEEARNASSIVVQIAGQTIPRDDPNGWVLSQDGGRITLRGEPCERLKSGMVDTISFSISCEDEPIIVDID